MAISHFVVLHIHALSTYICLHMYSSRLNTLIAWTHAALVIINFNVLSLCLYKHWRYRHGDGSCLDINKPSFGDCYVSFTHTLTHTHTHAHTCTHTHTHTHKINAHSHTQMHTHNICTHWNWVTYIDPNYLKELPLHVHVHVRTNIIDHTDLSHIL